MNIKSYVLINLLIISVISYFNNIFAAYSVHLSQAKNDRIELTFSLQDYEIKTMVINGTNCDAVILNKAAYDEEKGYPGLPQVAQSIIIPDRAKMRLEIISIIYSDKLVNTIAPSKGSISRKIDPESVLFEFGEIYQKESWFPIACAKLGTPYIARDFRAQVVYFQPFMYNPNIKTLRICSEIKVRVIPTNETGINVKKRVRPIQIGPNYHQIYSRRFINYKNFRYDPVDEEGSMLIISHGDFMSTMEPFVDWKNRRGIKTEIVDVADIGNTSAITEYVADYYTKNDLKYLLLVGDNDKVPTARSKKDASDNKYGCIEGDDSYVEVFVGRFSGTNASHIQTQVDKVLFYEREITGSDTWLNKGYGTFSSNEQDDRDAIAHIKTDMEAFTYERFNTGGSAFTERAPYNLIGDIGSGIGCHINSSHGNKTSIAGIKVSNVNSLNNKKMYPFNFTLACDPGTFDEGSDCLGEALLKRKDGGYVGAFMASISQPWYEPYAGIHEHTDILTEQYTDNIKRTYGGIAHNGCMKMIDDFARQGPWVSDTWVLFGDPSLLVYTDAPSPLTINHPDIVNNGSQNVDITGTEDATVCLYSKKLGIQAVKNLAGGSGTFSIEVNGETGDTIYVTGTLFNHETYEGFMTVITGPYISVSYPVSGNSFYAGEKINILWKTGGGASVTDVKIECSTDSGNTFTTIIDKTANDGTHEWTIPDIKESDECLIKVVDANGNLQDRSGVFSIKQKAAISCSPGGFSVGIMTNQTSDKKLTIANKGKGKLSFIITMKGGGSKILVNELYVSETTFFDGLELWNKGPDQDMTGWKVIWNDNQNTAGSYSFSSGFTFKSGKTLVLMDENSGTNDSTFYVGSNMYWDRGNTELSVAVLDAEGKGIDFVRSAGNSDDPPDGTSWNGTGVSLSQDYVYRKSNEDTDNALNWDAQSTGTINTINPGQSLSGVGEHWLKASVMEGTVEGLKELSVKVTFNSTGLANDDYYDTLIVTHNSADIASPVIIPCKLSVGTIGITNGRGLESSFDMYSYNSRLLYQIPKAGGYNRYKVTITLYNFHGRVIKTLVEEPKAPGYYSVDLENGKNKLAAGIYLGEMKVADFKKSIKVIVK